MGTDSPAQIDGAGRMKTTVPAFVPVIAFIFPQERRAETFIYERLIFQRNVTEKVRKCSFKQYTAISREAPKYTHNTQRAVNVTSLYDCQYANTIPNSLWN